MSKIELHHGDCRDVLRTLPDASIDSVVTDPPYGLSDHNPSDVRDCLRAWLADEGYRPAKHGFMGKAWDAWVPGPEVWREVYRVLKPGGHLLAFAGTRSMDMMSIAVRLAGFELRDSIGYAHDGGGAPLMAWCYGSGFPKSHDVSKAIDKAAGAEREVVGTRVVSRDFKAGDGEDIAFRSGRPGSTEVAVTVPATEAARQWQGWGTALKPAWEPIVLARKPLVGTVAENVLTHGTGALNIDGCRVKGTDKPNACKGTGWAAQDKKNAEQGFRPKAYYEGQDGVDYRPNDAGRWPANIIHDGSDEIVAAFPNGAARFFYSAKASKADRAGSRHPTVKPVALMRYLCRLVTPPGGTVLDPFAGSGTTGQAAVEEGFRAILIEREAEYVADIRRRLGLSEMATDTAYDGVFDVIFDVVFG